MTSDFILFLTKDMKEAKKISALNYKEEKTLQDLIKGHPHRSSSLGRIFHLPFDRITHRFRAGRIDRLAFRSDHVQLFHAGPCWKCNVPVDRAVRNRHSYLADGNVHQPTSFQKEKRRRLKWNSERIETAADIR